MDWSKLKTLKTPLNMIIDLIETRGWWDNHNVIRYVNGTKELILTKEFSTGRIQTKSVLFDEENKLTAIYNNNKKDWV